MVLTPSKQRLRQRELWWVGHVDISTTEIYARADTEMKRKALEKAYQNMISPDLPEWTDDADLLACLTRL